MGVTLLILTIRRCTIHFSFLNYKHQYKCMEFRLKLSFHSFKRYPKNLYNVEVFAVFLGLNMFNLDYSLSCICFV